MSKPKITLLLLLILSALATAAYVPYSIQQNKINDLTSETTNLRKQLENNKPVAQPQQNESTVNSPNYTSKKGVAVKIYSPSKGQTITSPMTVLGEVPGNWSFEASFPIVLKNSNGTIVAQSSAQLLGDWMTDKLVPFSAKLTFNAQQTQDGQLILQRDNPSGIPSNDDEVSIPVKL